MNQINSKSIRMINNLPPLAVKGDKISVDSEFFGQTKSKLHRPHGTFAFLGCSFDGESVFYITDENQVQEFFDRINAGVLIFHHAKYDFTQLRKFATIPNRKLLWDTMLIEQIRFSGYYNDFALNDLARRYLGVYLPKDIRKSFSETEEKNLKELGFDTVLSREQLEYSGVDVVVTWRIYQAQRAEIDENDLQIWKYIELPFLWSILSMGGIKLDTHKWSALAKKNEESAQQIRDKYPDINLNSPKQVKDYFKSKYHITAKSTDVEFLEKNVGNPFADDMLTYRKFAKRSSTYGEKFIEDYVEYDGKIYADLYQMGAETGRTSCRAPNLQNQPHEFEYRDCFVAEEGNCMIVADWGSQEPRIAAYLSQDAGLIDALNSDEKLYTIIARDALGIKITKKSPEYTHIKSIVLGIFYGMSAYGLSKAIGVSESDAQEMIDSILETYPGVKDYMDRQRKSKDYVISIYGRKIWLNKYSYQWVRNAINAPIQGSAADAMKLAAYKFLESWDDDIYRGTDLRLLVHDEIVLEVSQGNCEYAMKTLERCMLSVAEEMHENIKGSVEIYSGNSWACKS